MEGRRRLAGALNEPVPRRISTARPACDSTWRTVVTVRAEQLAAVAVAALVTAQCRPVPWSACAAKTRATRNSSETRTCAWAHAARPSSVSSQRSSSSNQPSRLVHIGVEAAVSPDSTIQRRRARRRSARNEREHATRERLRFPSRYSASPSPDFGCALPWNLSSKTVPSGKGASPLSRVAARLETSDRSP